MQSFQFQATNGQKVLPFSSAANANTYSKLWVQLEKKSVEVFEISESGEYRTIAYYGAKA